MQACGRATTYSLEVPEDICSPHTSTPNSYFSFDLLAISMIFTLFTNLSTWYLLSTILSLPLIFYVIYQRFFHPLSQYPGPFFGGLTDLLKFSYFWSLDIDKQIAKLHETYGPIVRIAPNELSFWGPHAVAPIYKSGRAMVKSSFFDGFTAFKPNLFGTRNEDVCVMYNYFL
jgi:hypothetical protein